MALLTNVLCLDSQHGGSRTGRLPRCARAAPTCDSLGTHYTDHAQHHRHDHGPADYGLDYDYDDSDYAHYDHYATSEALGDDPTQTPLFCGRPHFQTAVSNCRRQDVAGADLIGSIPIHL